MTSTLRTTTIVFLLALFSLSCKGPIEVALRGNDDMNGRNNVTVVYFQLTNNATFINASPASFWENDNAVLANDLAATKQILILSPGGEEQIEISPAKNATYLGFAADYRVPDPQGWRIIFSVDEVKGKTINLTAALDRLFAEVQ